MNNWIPVEERPLFIKLEGGRWQATEDGDKEFIAAVPFESANKPGEKLWWMRHCVIEETGLSVMTDDGTEPAGWEIDAITHWRPWVSNPDQLPAPGEKVSEQQLINYPTHPLTCGGSHALCFRNSSYAARSAGIDTPFTPENEGELIDKGDHFICPCGEYTEAKTKSKVSEQLTTPYRELTTEDFDAARAFADNYIKDTDPFPLTNEWDACHQAYCTALASVPSAEQFNQQEKQIELLHQQNVKMREALKQIAEMAPNIGPSHPAPQLAAAALSSTNNPLNDKD